MHRFEASATGSCEQGRVELRSTHSFALAATLWGLVITALVAAASLCGEEAATRRESSGATLRPIELADYGTFFVGGKYYQGPKGPAMADQMYVEFWIPRQRARPHPIVMIHGAGQTGANFTRTPDGRRGWAQFFVENGYAVYVVDQPARGRSAYAGERHGSTNRASARSVEQRYTAPAFYKLWPQAHLHSQWPGEGPGRGRQGDPIFDQFLASQVPSIKDVALTQKLVRDAGIALLDQIGAAILLTHSQAGPCGWAIADARPKLVRGIIAVEPAGAPVAPGPLADDKPQKWGITHLPLTYEPAVSEPAELRLQARNGPANPELCTPLLQAEPARRLPRLAEIPVLIVTGEASIHATKDHCTAEYLTQAGVDVDFIRLEQVGIRGNGHMMMLEKNNLEIARFLARWAKEHIP